MNALDETAQRWRELFMEVVEPYKHFPNFLSGGVDSATILAAQLALGAKPDVFTLKLGSYESGDYKVAASIAEKFGLFFHSVTIPRNDDVLIKDVRLMIGLLGTTRKTAIQCGQCMKHVATVAYRNGYNAALIGTGGVSEDCRKVWMILHSQGEEAAREFRRSTLFRSEGDVMDGTKAMHETSRLYGVELVEPYSMQPFADFSLSLDMAEIHVPVQKGIACRAFPEFWRAGHWYRKNKSMQVEGGIREWHDTLLSSTHNKRGSKTVVGVYNDMREEMAR